jgi:hypothetical protein
MTVYIASAPSSNGGMGSVAVNNYAAEIMSLRDCYLWADTPLVVSHANDWSMTSTFTTIESGATSTSQIVMDGGRNTLYCLSSGGQCLYISGAFGCRFRNIYFAGSGACSINLNGECVDVKINGHKESTGPVAILGSDNYCSSISVTMGGVSQSPFVAASGYVSLGNMTLEVIVDSGTMTAPYFYDSPSTNVIAGCVFKANYTPTAWTEITSNATHCSYWINQWPANVAILATGVSGRTVDDVISAMQALGLVRQS